MNEEQVQLTRRGFLAVAACAPVLVAGALLARRAVPALPAVPVEADEQPGVGYHETEHIRTYYRTTSLL
jgi:hypothetical protein